MARLSPTLFTAVQYDLDLPSLPTSSATGDFLTSSLAARVNTSAVNDLVVRSYLHKAADRRSTLVFAVDLDHIANLVTAFRQAGVDARSVSSKSHSRDRRETLQAFKDGEFPVLVNCQVLTEAADIPCVSATSRCSWFRCLIYRLTASCWLDRRRARICSLRWYVHFRDTKQHWFVWPLTFRSDGAYVSPRGLAKGTAISLIWSITRPTSMACSSLPACGVYRMTMRLRYHAKASQTTLFLQTQHPRPRNRCKSSG